MGRGAGACLAALIRRGPARGRKPEGYLGAHAAVLRSGDTALRVARRAHVGRRSWQFTARADHGLGKTFAGRHSGPRARHRRADHLSAERRCHGGLEARSGGMSDKPSNKAEIVCLSAPLADGALAQLAEILVDCVEGGASVSFMSPFSQDQALAFFRKVASSLEAGDTILLAATLDGQIVGSVQLGLDTPPNQPHRAEIKKPL